MNPMSYKGYAARIDYSEEDEAFIGRVAGIRDIVTFHGASVDEIRAAFHEAVDFYLSTCAERGEPPQKPYSGKLMLRVPPELHARAAMRVEAAGKSLNAWVAETLAKAV
ncbi:MAG: type II toxin-antitoxin system HicB family antitoxin [Alphaproteobacteria bacterium]|nr:type II toxin-antitoxin system HicB family antitoxin [Alphaproteobacteria bacterium]MBM3653727.1 type II toxin-antitoxin system HicB family antitoxin [Alphaproteobacteria bacterium]